MPLEALLFFMTHIWLVVLGLTAVSVIGLGINFMLDMYVLVITLGLFVLFFVPTVAIVQNIVSSREDFRRSLCCVPLLIAGIYETMTATIGHTKIMLYESHPDSLVYTLLLPIQRFAEIVIYPTTDEILYMGFPYNQLPQLTLYIVLLPIGLFIYLLPSISYDWRKITKEMKLILLLPLFCVAIPIIWQTAKMRLGLIDEIMMQFYWIEVTSDIKLLGFFLLLPILGILYIKQYNMMISGNYSATL